MHCIAAQVYLLKPYNVIVLEFKSSVAKALSNPGRVDVMKAPAEHSINGTT